MANKNRTDLWFNNAASFSFNSCLFFNHLSYYVCILFIYLFQRNVLTVVVHFQLPWLYYILYSISTYTVYYSSQSKQ